MNQKQLRYFWEVYQTCNIQQAADKLHIRRQGVSKTLRQLEQELGQPLFLRTAQGLEPTDFAAGLLPHARRLLDEYAYIEGMNSLAGQKQNLVTVYALDHVLAYLSADFLLDFKKAYPAIIPSLVECTDEAALNGLLTQDCDLALVTGPLDPSQFTAEPLFFSRYCIQLRRDHPLAAQKEITFQDLAGLPLISKGRAYRCFREHMNRDMLLPGLTVNILAETTDSTVVQDLILKGNGINLSYDYIACLQSHPDIVLRTLSVPEQGQEIYLAALRNALPTKAIRHFREFLLAWIPQQGKAKITWPRE